MSGLLPNDFSVHRPLSPVITSKADRPQSTVGSTGGGNTLIF
jgi:hypothetical protein